MKIHLMTAMAILAWMAAAVAADGGVVAYEQGKVYGPIEILGNEPRTVDGNGAIIDGGGTNRCATLGQGVTLKNFTFRNGTAAVGGGVWGGKVENCTIRDCTASEYGAAVANCKVSATTITGCKLMLGDSGTAAMHGGIAADSTLDGVTITGCRVELGTATPGFGGIAANSDLIGCTVVGNTLDASGDHYGLLFYGGSLESSTIQGNSVGSSVGNVAAYMRVTPSGCTLDKSPGPTPPDPVYPQPDPSTYQSETDPVLAIGEGMVGRYYRPVYLDQLNRGLGRSYDRKTTVKAEGLPSGLKLVKESTGNGLYDYSITGVPTEPMDGVTRIAYVRVTDTAKNVLFLPLEALRILPATVARFPDATNKVEYWKFPVAAVWPGYAGHEENWTFSGWPAGIKFAASAMMYNGNQVPGGYVYGKPTKVGVYTVKATERAEGVTYKNTHYATFVVRYEDGLEPTPVVKPTPAAVLDLPSDMHVTVSGVKDIRVGVACEWAVTNTPYSTVTVSGLPSGLRLVSSNVTDRVTRMKTYFYRVTGVPTRAGYFLSTFTAKLNGVSSKSTVAFNAVALPDWAQGTFDGGADETFPAVGQVTFTMSKAGKLSGKWMSGGTNWTLRADSYASYDWGDGSYLADVTYKTGSGKTARSFTDELTVTVDWLGGIATNGMFLAYQNNWKYDPWKTLGKTIAKAPAFEFKPYADAGDDHTNDFISLKFSASGKVTVKASYFKSVSKAGRISWTTASGSAVLCPQGQPGEGDAFPAVVFVYLPPKKGTPTAEAGYSACVRLWWNGEKFVEWADPE